MKLEAAGIEKWYFRGKGDSNRFFAVKSTDLVLAPGTVTVLSGRSGSGKTTLLHMMAGLLTPDGGTICADEKDLYGMTDAELSRFRNEHMGVIPQSAELLPVLTVMENILLPQGLFSGHAGSEPGVLREKAKTLLETMDIPSLADVQARELSGGELRRAAVARALCASPDLVFADEPTSDLDDGNMRVVLELLRKAADEGAAVMIVTHDPEAKEYADCCLNMKQGEIRQDGMGQDNKIKHKP